MTNAVNRIIATDDIANSEFNNTTSMTTKTSATASSATASYSDSVSYSVVDIGKAPDGYDDMKDILNKCISSYKDMADYVQNLKGNNEHLFVQMNAKSSEIADLSTDDGTGNGANSAYSLDFQDEKTGKDDKTKTEDTQKEQSKEKEIQKFANRQEIQSKITIKQSEVDDLNNTASQNSNELAQVKLDMDTNQDTIGKIMEKVGNDTSHINGMMRYANAGAVGGGIVGATGSDAVTGTIGCIFGFSSIFGGGKAKKRAEITQLGKEAYRAEREVSRAVQQCSNALNSSEIVSDDASNKLKEKQSALETN